MLELAGLGKYTKMFTVEEISGEVLLECDKGVLQSELGINSEVHLQMFLTLIEGKASQHIYKLGRF